MRPDEPTLAALVDRVCEEAAALPGEVGPIVADAVDRVAPLLDGDARSAVVARAMARLTGLDVLDEHLRDPAVDEVMVNAGREVWVERAGRTERVATIAPGVVETVVERILAPLGRRLDRANPIVDARLADGARVCAVVEPVAVDGTCLAIRRHRARTLPLERFASRPVVELLDHLVRARGNVLVCGATSSGKTTLLGALARRIDAGARLVVIEDTAELDLRDRHAIRLEARAANADGVRAVGLDELVRTALRLRPDRLIVGEFRGDEVLAVVQALNTGHDGSLSTCHANAAADGLRRVETLVLQAAPAWPLPAIRAHVTRSLDAIVHVERSTDGERHVVEVLEVVESGDEPHGRLLADRSGVLDEPVRRRR